MNLATAVNSSIGRKLITGVTGLLLIGFVVGHLTGNFLLLVGPKAFNEYAYFLEHMFHGAGLIVAEIGLIVLFLSHAWSGYSVWANKWKARSVAYQEPGSAGGRSKKSVSSTSMLWTGLLLLAFVIWHVLQFKFGVIDTANRDVTVGSVDMRNLYGIVIDTFSNPGWTIFYMLIMAALGTHLWHGAWSAFQSIGLANDKYMPVLNKGAHLVAAVLAAGFLFLPAYIMMRSDHFNKLDDQFMQDYPRQTQQQSNGDEYKTNVSGATLQTAEKGA